MSSDLRERAVPTNPEHISVLRMTALQIKLMEAFTLKTPVAREDEPDAHLVWFVVDSQAFRLDGSQDSAEEADWTRAMLAKALDRAIERFEDQAL